MFGDPFDGYNDDPGHSFGFVVLGTVLTLFVQFAWSFADARGWTDPITRRCVPRPRRRTRTSAGASCTAGVHADRCIK